MDEPKQMVSLIPALITKAGFTDIVKLSGNPLQPSAVGVTVIIASMTPLPLLVAVKEGTEPTPLEGKPIDGSVLFHT